MQMPGSIENYIPQIVVGKIRRQAIFVWSAASLLIFGWVFLIIFAPIFQANDFINVSQPIYNFFGYLCHQIPARSFHFQNQQFAVCTRCFGIYLGLFAGFIVYPFLRPVNETEPLPRFWLFLAMIPMLVDWSLGFFEIWENTDFSRFLTGLILGAACAVFIIPALVEILRLLPKRA